MSINWKRATKNFVLAGGIWAAITMVSVVFNYSAPQGISLALASGIVGGLVVILSYRLRFLDRRISLSVAGIALSVATSAIPSEIGLSSLDGIAVLVSVIGVIGCVCALLYFALTD